MARIQILELPMVHLGEVSKTPFAIIIDQVDTETTSTSTGVEFRTFSELTQAEADKMAREVGAVGAILVACTLEVG